MSTIDTGSSSQCPRQPIPPAATGVSSGTDPVQGPPIPGAPSGTSSSSSPGSSGGASNPSPEHYVPTPASQRPNGGLFSLASSSSFFGFSSTTPPSHPSGAAQGPGQEMGHSSSQCDVELLPHPQRPRSPILFPIHGAPSGPAPTRTTGPVDDSRAAAVSGGLGAGGPLGRGTDIRVADGGGPAAVVSPTVFSAGLSESRSTPSHAGGRGHSGGNGRDASRGGGERAATVVLGACIGCGGPSPVGCSMCMACWKSRTCSKCGLHNDTKYVQCSSCWKATRTGRNAAAAALSSSAAAAGGGGDPAPPRTPVVLPDEAKKLPGDRRQPPVAAEILPDALVDRATTDDRSGRSERQERRHRHRQSEQACRSEDDEYVEDDECDRREYGRGEAARPRRGHREGRSQSAVQDRAGGKASEGNRRVAPDDTAKAARRRRPIYGSDAGDGDGSCGERGSERDGDLRRRRTRGEALRENARVRGSGPAGASSAASSSGSSTSASVPRSSVPRRSGALGCDARGADEVDPPTTGGGGAAGAAGGFARLVSSFTRRFGRHGHPSLAEQRRLAEDYVFGKIVGSKQFESIVDVGGQLGGIRRWIGRLSEINREVRRTAARGDGRKRPVGVPTAVHVLCPMVLGSDAHRNPENDGHYVDPVSGLGTLTHPLSDLVELTWCKCKMGECQHVNELPEGPVAWMSVHVLYYLTEDDLERVNFAGRDVMYHVVHRYAFHQSSGELGGGKDPDGNPRRAEYTWQRNPGGLIVMTPCNLGGSVYRHRDIEPMLLCGLKYAYDVTSNGTQVVVPTESSAPDYLTRTGGWRYINFCELTGHEATQTSIFVMRGVEVMEDFELPRIEGYRMPRKDIPAVDQIIERWWSEHPTVPAGEASISTMRKRVVALLKVDSTTAELYVEERAPVVAAQQQRARKFYGVLRQFVDPRASEDNLFAVLTWAVAVIILGVLFFFKCMRMRGIPRGYAAFMGMGAAAVALFAFVIVLLQRIFRILFRRHRDGTLGSELQTLSPANLLTRALTTLMPVGTLPSGI